MIEIEKKFLVNQYGLMKIIRNAKFISSQKLIDIYYDKPSFGLTRKDWWLRNRNGKIELKMVIIDNNKNNAIDRYKEVDHELNIRELLNIKSNKPLLESLETYGIKPFARIIAQRKKYKKSEFTIDFDITDFGYSICEVEILVKNDSEIQQALEKIEKFRKQNNLSSKVVRGKLIEYIYENRPKHYQVLLKAGVIK